MFCTNHMKLSTVRVISQSDYMCMSWLPSGEQEGMVVAWGLYSVVPSKRPLFETPFRHLYMWNHWIFLMRCHDILQLCLWNRNCKFAAVFGYFWKRCRNRLPHVPGNKYFSQNVWIVCSCACGNRAGYLWRDFRTICSRVFIYLFFYLFFFFGLCGFFWQYSWRGWQEMGWERGGVTRSKGTTEPKETFTISTVWGNIRCQHEF